MFLINKKLSIYKSNDFISYFSFLILQLSSNYFDG